MPLYTSPQPAQQKLIELAFSAGLTEGERIAIEQPAQRITEQPRQWVGLTDEEIQKLRQNFATRPAIAAIEAKLKEKNT